MGKKASWKATAMQALLIALLCFQGTAKTVFAQSEQVVIIQQTEGEILHSFEVTEEVAAINQSIQSVEKSGVVSLAAITQMSSQTVKDKIEQFYIPDAGEYLDGVKRQEGDLDAIIERRNLSALEGNIELRYGVLADNTAVRTYPTWQKLSGAENVDYFQEAFLPVGEGVIVLHQTQDEIWSFIQAANVCGWIETSNIAFCMREEMLLYADPEYFAIVAESSVTIGNDEFWMGTRLPLSRLTDTTATIWLPQMTENGNLYQIEQEVSLQSGFHIGYMEWEQGLFIEQAYKLLNIVYGDMERSACELNAVSAIYSCFGIVLPKNSAGLLYLSDNLYDVRAMSSQEKINFLEKQKIGSLLISTKDISMYLGELNGQIQLFHDVGSYSVDGINTIEANCCILTPLTIYTSEKESYLEVVDYVLIF